MQVQASAGDHRHRCGLLGVICLQLFLWFACASTQGAYILYGDLANKFTDPHELKGFVAKRRSEVNGTSTCRNSGQETFLWFRPQERSVTTRRLEELAATIGADPSMAMALMSLTSHSVLPGASASPAPAPSPLPGQSSSPPDPEKPAPKKKAKKERLAGSEMELVVEEADSLETFIPAWVKSATAAQGQCAQLMAQCFDCMFFWLECFAWW